MNRSKLNIATIIFGVLAAGSFRVTLPALVFSFLAIATGLYSLFTESRSEENTHKGLAVTGIIISLVVLLYLVLSDVSG